MRIKDIYFERFGMYKNWRFTPPEKGLTLLYGPNESGKTTLLEGVRGILFGWRPKMRKESAGYLTIDRGGRDYHLGRDGKKLDFYPLGEKAISAEPSQLWWHGLDRKTYERIFALTLEDLQGSAIIHESDVRSRFFGIEGGERLSHTAENIEKEAADLLVASANGKRKINVLTEKMKQLDTSIEMLGRQETEFADIRRRLKDTEKTEGELQGSLQQWQEYSRSIEMVLRAWDTYRRAEEAKVKMDSLMDGALPEQEQFLNLDREINQCREHMRIWRGKEEGLIPDNFSPDSPLNVHGQEVDLLYEQLGRWEQLAKECGQGETYLKKVSEQLSLSRKMQSTWRDDQSMPEDVDWFAGEKASTALRLAEDGIDQWKLREPTRPEGVAQEGEGAYTAERIADLGNGTDEMRAAYNEKVQSISEYAKMELHPPKTIFFMVFSLIMAVLTALMYILGRADLNAGWVTGMVLTVCFGGASFVYARYREKQYKDSIVELRKAVSDAERKMIQLRETFGLPIPKSIDDLNEMRTSYEEKRRAYYGHDVELAKLHGYEQQRKVWTTEGESLKAQLATSEKNWQDWCPPGISKVVSGRDFFAIKQEYDIYMEQKARFDGYKKKLKEHQEEYDQILNSATILWHNLQLEGAPNTTELRRLYSTLQNYRQNKVRWEQKETQRKTYREEFDQWHRKEKDLLLQQEEILQKAGFSTANEYRRKMLSLEQYRQWETIYKQSKIQLDLLAPNRDSYDLLTRRLREGNKSKWEDEARRGEDQIASIEQRLASLYEQRGELTETMRRMGADQTLTKLLQERKQTEEVLSEALQTWVTQILVSHFIEQAQHRYEKEKQPMVMETASHYTQVLTNGAYGLTLLPGSKELVAVSGDGTQIASDLWSSGMGDQIYLALRLSLAKTFGRQAEPLPIILDDILLRFDEERQKSALSLLAEIGREEQIWLFTCQEQLLRLAEQLKNDDIKLYRIHLKNVVEV